jgi:predicted RNase H-like HicB family nuclease
MNDTTRIGEIKKKGRWYIGTVKRMPGVNTQGRTLAEARRNLNEAIELIIESNRSLKIPGPK